MEFTWINMLKMLEIMLIASVKFLFSPFEAERQGFSFWPAFIITTIGGLIGIFAFTFLGDVIAVRWQKIIHAIKVITGKAAKEDPIHPPLKHNKRNRLLVHLRNHFGLGGIAFVTPAIISIPIGTFVANRFYKDKKDILIALIVALLIWSVALNLLAQYLSLSQSIKNLG